jgi:hypothetical protein
MRWRFNILYPVRITALVLLALSLAGCVISHPEYPTQWAPPEPLAMGCASIAGSYNDAADAVEPKAKVWTRPSLARTLLSPGETGLPLATKVVIAQLASGVIGFSATSDTGGVLATRRLSADANDYQCRDGAIELRKTRKLIGGPGVTMMGIDTLRLMKSVDGALVVKHTEAGFGMCVIFPCGGSEDRWYRFTPSTR